MRSMHRPPRLRPVHSTGRASRWIPLLLGLALLASAASAQIDVTATAGNTGPVTYTTLKLAFDAVNDGTHQGVITMAVTADTTETVPAVLNASGSGAASYTSVAISPTGGAARTISGAIAAGSPLIDLNGADNVTIDGLNTGGNALTISNTTASGTSATSTIRFIGGATGNLVTNATVLGSFNAAVGTNGGNIYFATDALTANGNDNNTISNNDIGPAGANLATKGVYFNGSTTTTAINNSGNVVTGNLIHDYFGAAVTSAGIYVGGGTTDCTFSNNKFYQTATRTQTTAAQHSAIWIANSSGNNFQVTGNTIGFASSAGTGTYTFVGVGSGSVLVPIFLNVGTTTASSVQGNTIAGISMSGAVSGTSSSASFRGIYVSSGLATVGDVSGNTIGSQSANGSIAFTSSSASSADVIGIFNFGSSAWTASNNLIGGITAANSSTGAANVYGIRVNTGSGVTFTCQNNTVGGTVANSLQSTSTATGSTVQGIKNDNPAGTITGNTIRNLTAAGGTGTTTTASVIGISVTITGSNQTVTQNTIYNLTNTNASAATVVTGIQFSGSTANVVSRNLIHSLSSATTSATAEVNGIRVAGGTTIYRNNMIAVGAGVANAIGAVAGNATTTGINGINEASGTNSFFHNSVYVGGAPTAGTGASYAFNATVTTNTRSDRDNIFFNGRSNGGATGKNYAIKVNGTTPNPTGLTLNNNLYFANGVGAAFGFFNSLDVADLAAWRIAVGQDAGSFESNPQYLDPTNSVPDLHLHPTNATVAEGNGFDVGVADDFDGQTRSGLTPVDIGADAGNFVGIDLAPPVIAYTPLANTSSTANRTLNATITDNVSGVPTAGIGLPVIYFRKGNAGAFAATQATSGGGGSYTFTIDYSLVSGGSVTAGDTIQYYVAAQDGAVPPNVAVSPSAGASGLTSDPPAAATPPTTPNSYLIAVQLSGIKTVCSAGCDYASLTAAGGVFATINSNVLVGNLQVQVAGDLVAEDGANALNALPEEPVGSNFTVRIYPTGSARLVSGTFAGALVRFFGASRVTIDGSLGGVGTDRSLTIQNLSATSPGVVLFGSVGTTPISNGALRNCVIVNGAITSSAVIVSDGTTAGNAGYFSNITIQNNDIQKAYIGVYASGGTTPQGGSNLTYTQNTLTASGANAIRLVGLYMQGVNGATVSDNTLGNFSNSEGENDTGIWLASGTGNVTVSGNTVNNLGMTLTTGFAPYGIRESSGLAASGNTISGNTVTNLSTTGSTGLRGIAASSGGVTIARNKIQGIINNNTGTYGAFGIDVTAGSNDVIKNNFISDVNHNMTGGAAFGPDFGVVGIRLGSGTGHKVYNNSVNLFGPHTGTPTTSLLSAAFSISSTTQTGIDVRDNIFANNITGGTTSIAHVSVFLPSGGTSAMDLTWNNNSYYFGTDVTTQGIGQAGTTAGTNFFQTLAALAAYSSTLSGAGTNDNASLESTGAVPFLSSTDLHLLPGSPELDAGIALVAVTDDIDGDPRPAATPDIGADEVVQADLAITKDDGVGSVLPGGTTTYTIVATNLGASDALGATVTDTFPAFLSCSTTCLASGSASCTAGPFVTNINDTVNLPAGGTVTYTSVCNVSGAASGSIANTASVAPPVGVSDPNAANDSATDTDIVGSASADLAITKDDGVSTVIAGHNTTYTIGVSNAGPSPAGSATVTDNFPAACTSVSWTCAGAGGGTCTASGSSNISDSVSLPAGGSVTYTAVCAISAAGSGTLSNTATVTFAGDPNSANNSATDVDTLLPLLVFADGFETGDTSQWSSTTPLTLQVLASFPVDPGSSDVVFDYDFAALPAATPHAPSNLVLVTDADGRSLLALEARRLGSDPTLELALLVPGAARSAWEPIAGVQQQLRLEWAAAADGYEGHLALYLDGRLALWVDGFAPAASPARVGLLGVPAAANGN